MQPFTKQGHSSKVIPSWFYQFSVPGKASFRKPCTCQDDWYSITPNNPAVNPPTFVCGKYY